MAASSAPAPSLRFRPSSRASLRAARPVRSRSAVCASSRVLASRSSRSSSAATARLVLGVEALLAGVEPGDPGLERGEVVLGPLRPGHGLLRAPRSRRPTSSSAAAARLFRALTWPCRRARPSRRSAAARSSPATRRSSSACACSACCAGGRRRSRAPSGCPRPRRAISLLLGADPLGLGLELARGRGRTGTPARRCRARCAPARRPGRPSA